MKLIEICNALKEMKPGEVKTVCGKRILRYSDNRMWSEYDRVLLPLSLTQMVEHLKEPTDER